MTRRIVGVIAAVAACSFGVEAQQLAKGGVPDTFRRSDTAARGRELVASTFTWEPRTHTEWHLHPGEMVGHVAEGTLRVEEEGKPPVTYHAGQTFIVRAGVPHDCTNDTASRTRVFVTYLLEKGKPLSVPVQGTR